MYCILWSTEYINNVQNEISVNTLESIRFVVQTYSRKANEAEIDSLTVWRDYI
jgi:hypothetical protein